MTQVKYLKKLLLHLRICAVYDTNKENPAKRKVFLFYKIFVTLSIIITFIQNGIYIAQRPALLKDTNFLRDIMFYVTGPIFALYMNWKQKKLYGMIEKLQNIIEKTENPIEELTIQRSVRLSELFGLMWISYLSFFVANYAISTFLAPERALLMTAWYPFEVLDSPLYELIWIWQSFCFYIMNLAHCIGDTIMMSCITLLKQQFKILRSNLKYSFYQALKNADISDTTIKQFYKEIQIADMNDELIRNTMSKALNGNFEKYLYEQLSKCVKHHQYLLDCCSDLVDILSPTLFPRVSVCTFFLLVSALTILTQTDSNEITKSAITCVASLMTTSILCYLGEQLTQSSDVYDGIVDTPWYLYDIRSKRLLVCVLERLRRLPLVKAGPFFIMNYATFVTIMRASYSYIIFVYQFMTE